MKTYIVTYYRRDNSLLASKRIKGKDDDHALFKGELNEPIGSAYFTLIKIKE